MEFAVTISPDPTRIVNQTQKRSYGMCTPMEQYRVIKNAIKFASNINEIHRSGAMLEFYFEFNEGYMLHCHGILKVADVESKIMFQRMIYRNLGRLYSKNYNRDMDICCTIKDLDHVNQYRHVNGDKSWIEYCQKDQTEDHKNKYKPLVMNIPKWDTEGLDKK